jgi:hypothetical protein
VDSGLRPRRRYTVGDALEDWLARGVVGLSARTAQIAHNVLVRAVRHAIPPHDLPDDLRAVLGIGDDLRGDRQVHSDSVLQVDSEGLVHAEVREPVAGHGCGRPRA